MIERRSDHARRARILRMRHRRRRTQVTAKHDLRNGGSSAATTHARIGAKSHCLTKIIYNPQKEKPR